MKAKANWKEQNKEVVQEEGKWAVEEKEPAKMGEGNKCDLEDEEEEEEEHKVNSNWQKSETE